VAAVADALAPDYPRLAQLLRQPAPGGGPPLLAAAFAYFFRREVESSPELARGLTFGSLERLSASQAAAFGKLGAALEALGARFDELLGQVMEQLGRIEAVAVQTHGAVLDLHAELNRLSGLHLSSAEEVRRLIQEVVERLARVGMQAGQLRPQDSFSIRSEDERRAVRQLLDRFRLLSPEEQRRVPALLNGLGKLQVGAGDYAEARQTFATAAAAAGDPAGQAEAHFNAYRAALEQRRWDEALTAIRAAAERDPERFAPFPLKRYQPRRILGAGGFGTAFLCHDRHFDEEVVIKSLHAADLERGLDEVFREARVLRRLSHPAVIGVRDCDYADTAGSARPYLVMDFFPGGSLGAFVRERGPLSPAELLAVARPIAEAMNVAHAQGLLHRDLKPDNVLVRKEGERWRVKVIDFGLALRHQVIETSLARASGEETVLGSSVAGTVKYAPPEQMGQLLDAGGRRVPVGPYSDVFAFGKLCCYALFRTTEPKSRHWGSSPAHGKLREVLERCIEEELEHRYPGFEPVLAVLGALDPEKTDQQRQAKEQRRQEQERQQQERARLQQEGEAKLARLIRKALDRTRGRPTAEDSAAAKELCQHHHIPSERAQAIAREVREEWQRDRPREPRAGETLAISLGKGLDMTFAWIPPGTFLMGSLPTEERRDDDEPQHRVTLTKGFYLGIHQVTHGQFVQFVQATGYKTDAETGGGAYYRSAWTPPPIHRRGKKSARGAHYRGSVWKLDPAKNWRAPGFNQTDAHPVVCISWNDAVAFCEWLMRRDGQGRRYRLPTEAEWEYACRAGTTTPFHFGEIISTDQANYDGHYTYGKGTEGVHRQQTAPVGSFPPNPWGLYDMHGNVEEWCQDWYGPYPAENMKDPQGVEQGDYRVLRGGSWYSYPWTCRAACRGRRAPARRYDFCGCRVVLFDKSDT
jgi:formylglycine-generating enzyme required for sulfatase activity/tRNA A-37 threonylcarbamoyl transferase component Bud32